MCAVYFVIEAIHVYFKYLEEKKRKVFLNLGKTLVCFLPTIFIITINLSINMLL